MLTKVQAQTAHNPYEAKDRKCHLRKQLEPNTHNPTNSQEHEELLNHGPIADTPYSQPYEFLPSSGDSSYFVQLSESQFRATYIIGSFLFDSEANFFDAEASMSSLESEQRLPCKRHRASEYT